MTKDHYVNTSPMKTTAKVLIGITLLIIVAILGWYFLGMTDSDPSAAPTPPSQGTVTQLTEQEDPSTIQIIAFGDSLTAGLGLPLAESYPAQLEQRLKDLGQNVQVINSGVSGETTAGNNARAEFIRSQNPDMVILGIGGNDALRFLSVEEAYTNMQTTLETLLTGDNPPKVLLLNIQAPLNAGIEYKESFDALYPKLASEFNVPLVPFVTEEVARNPELLQADGIHPTGDGYTLLVNTYILPAIKQLLPVTTP